MNTAVLVATMSMLKKSATSIAPPVLMFHFSPLMVAAT
jgi:hypothetical protein